MGIIFEYLMSGVVDVSVGGMAFSLPSLSTQAQLPTASIYISFPPRLFFFFSVVVIHILSGKHV